MRAPGPRTHTAPLPSPLRALSGEKEGGSPHTSGASQTEKYYKHSQQRRQNSLL